MSWIVFDAGGTNLRVAVASGGRLKHFRTLPTPKSWSATRAVFSEIKKSIGPEKVTSVVGGLPGLINQRTQILLDAPNLKGWQKQSITKDLKKIFKAPIMLENDAALAGLGEAHYGRGKTKGIMAYITVGTGVGGARIVDGQIDRRSSGFEPGHQVIQISPNGRPETLEDLVSGYNIKRRFGIPSAELRNQRIWKKLAL